MSAKLVGRSEPEVMESLARMARLRREQVEAPKLRPWPVDAYVAAALTLILSARSVIADAVEDPEQVIRGFDGRVYVRQGDVVLAARQLDTGEVEARPVRERPSLFRSMRARLAR
jgi:hypothetical protein